VAALAAAGAGPSYATAPTDDPFPTWPQIESQVAFWIDIYTRYTTRQAVLHDSEFPEVVYAVVELGGAPSDDDRDYPETDREIMRLARERVEALLSGFEASESSAARLADVARQVHRAWQSLPEGRGRTEAARRVRAQRGQADRFRRSLVRSGRYLESFREIARRVGVPEDLVYLPHVESSFNPLARSHAGAAGLWQFMRGTARRYLTVSRSLDQRLDPWVSAEAAFRFLQENHDALGSWPLAVTAYNHGLGGMLRAQKRFGTDLQRIIEEYSARNFGFASKNFYAEFLAARQIARAPERWFGSLAMEPALRHERFTVPEYVQADALADQFNLRAARLRELNPALDPLVWESRALIPRGYDLNLPPGYAGLLASRWTEIPAAQRYERVVEDAWHRVRRGDSLSLIAARHGTSVRNLRTLNQLWNQRFIYPGQVLKVRETEKWISVAEREAARHSQRHVVQKGETLSAIGVRYGIALADLVHANRIRDASKILVGQILLIPRQN
jgi:membrane-bound lytic murein transglycosylase D